MLRECRAGGGGGDASATANLLPIFDEQVIIYYCYYCHRLLRAESLKKKNMGTTTVTDNDTS